MQFIAINNLVELLALAGIRHIIICPGSRNAALTIAFARHGGFILHSITDERSAGFVALGIGQASRKAAVVITTSGTAAANLAPAVIEAYFQQIPLLAITADRPPESVGQQDGQAIFQQALFGSNIKAFFTLPTLENHPDTLAYAARITNQAIHLTQSLPLGPVHINIPIREPFYPEAGEKHIFKNVRLITHIKGVPTLTKNDLHSISQEFFGFKKVIIAVGQYPFGPDEALINALQALIYYAHVPVLADVTANISRVEGIIHHYEIFLPNANDADTTNANVDFTPDLLITLGGAFVSKKLKTWLRTHQPAHHWHIWPQDAQPPDTFLALNKYICANEHQVIEYLANQAYFQAIEPNNYYNHFENSEKNAVTKLKTIFENLPFGEFRAVHELMNRLPDYGLLHFANSMPIRYGAYIGLSTQSRIVVCANRGTSGIDGSLSTAVGAAMTRPDLAVFCIIGDLSFFYDQNALWQNNLPKNLRIIMLNNHGGIIFGLINGPSKQAELQDLFITHQTRSAAAVAQLHQIAYQLADEQLSLQAGLDWILSGFDDNNAGPLLLEIQTDSRSQISIFKKFKEDLL